MLKSNEDKLMDEGGIIERRKKLFDIPIKDNKIEYWGPINYNFSESFLNMGSAFLSSNPKLSKSKCKKFFTSFVELVQNIAKYNETETENDYFHSYVNLHMYDDEVILRTANQIDESHVKSFKLKFDRIFAIPKVELIDHYKTALMEKESLGLIMVRGLEDSRLEWEIVKEAENNWLIFKLQMSYG